jgi:hypothetical protein
MENKNDLLKCITNYYLESNDFNGLPTWESVKKYRKNEKLFRSHLVELIDEDKVAILFMDSTENAFINRLGFGKKEIQKKRIKNDVDLRGCLYPSSNQLIKTVSKNKYKEEPYKLCLALGAPQLSFKSFDLSILEFYRNDPRYRYKNDDIRGQIYYDSDDLAQSDKTYLKTFGFSYNPDLNRAVVVFVRYLADLTPEHQQIWKTKELDSSYKLHPDYFRNSILGQWSEKEPICTAFLLELYIINQMTLAINKHKLFKTDFGIYPNKRPANFGLLVRPTLSEYHNFILVLDKLLSENINKKFFINTVDFEKEIERSDGKIQVTQKGSLQILDEWISRYFKTNDWSLWEESIKALKKVRKLRQKPAHSLNDNIFDMKFFKEQRDLLVKSYNALRTIRLMLANHPKVVKSNIDIPNWLFKGEIWDR